MIVKTAYHWTVEVEHHLKTPMAMATQIYRKRLLAQDRDDPCDPDPECAACLALKPPTPTKPPAVTTPTPENPGFEAVFTIAGLLAVAYLVRRRK